MRAKTVLIRSICQSTEAATLAIASDLDVVDILGKVRRLPLAYIGGLYMLTQITPRWHVH